MKYPLPSTPVSESFRARRNRTAVLINIINLKNFFRFEPNRTGKSDQQKERQVSLMPYDYITNADVIYRKSFAIIRAEAELANFSRREEQIAVRMIHAAGDIALEKSIRFSRTFAEIATKALVAGAPILCDTKMVSEGITRSRLPAANDIICTLSDSRVNDLSRSLNTTRSAAALELWQDHMAGAIVAIGNAPTALFHLLNLLEDRRQPRPAAIIGCPVGFVGASESKDALWQTQPTPCCTVLGRLGGSAITVATINAVASHDE